MAGASERRKGRASRVPLANGAARYPNVVIADWATLAEQNPQWFGPDGTHLAIDGPGADALAALVASTLSDGASPAPA